jgi:hypothetical protein
VPALNVPPTRAPAKPASAICRKVCDQSMSVPVPVDAATAPMASCTASVTPSEAKPLTVDPATDRTKRGFTGASRTRFATCSAVSRPNARTSREPMPPGTAVSSAAMAEPPIQTAADGSASGSIAFTAPCVSPTPIASAGRNAPTRPPIVAPAGPSGAPIAAPA